MVPLHTFPAELSFCSFSQNKKLQSIRLCRTRLVVGASMRYVTTTAIVYPNTTAPGPGRTPTITAHREAILITYLADTFKMLSQVQITLDELSGPKNSRVMFAVPPRQPRVEADAGWSGLKQGTSSNAAIDHLLLDYDLTHTPCLLTHSLLCSSGSWINMSGRTAH